jgi:DNA-binding CsgD family transcriptional regulator
MVGLDDYFSQCAVKHENKIKTICAPLRDYLGIPVFTYFYIDQNGSFVNFSQLAEDIEILYSEQLYLDDPHLIHPHLLRSGMLFIPNAFNPQFLQKICARNKIQHLLLILKRYDDHVEGFYFGTRADSTSNHANLFMRVDLLERFTRYFKREALYLIESVKNDGYNLQKEKGKVFAQNHTAALANQDPHAQKFLEAVGGSLSFREQQCLQLFKHGRSAQATAAILGLSQRTVESYFENIKNKTGCRTKADLLEW